MTELRLQLPTLPGAHTRPVHFPLPASGGLSSGARGVPLVPVCSSSFYPRRDSLATSSAPVQLPRFGSHLNLSLGPSRDPPPGPAHIPATLVCTQPWKATFRQIAHVLSPASLQPQSHLPPLPCSWSLCCHCSVTWSFNMSSQVGWHQGQATVARGRSPLLPRWRFWSLFPFVFSFLLEGASGERMSSC